MFRSSSTPSWSSRDRLAALILSVLVAFVATINSSAQDAPVYAPEFRAFGSTYDAAEYARLIETSLTFNATAGSGSFSWDAAGGEFELGDDLNITSGGLSLGGTLVISSARALGNISNSTGSTNVVFSDTPTLATPNWTGTATGAGLTMTGSLEIGNDTGTGSFVRATDPTLPGTASAIFTLDSDQAGSATSYVGIGANRGSTGVDALWQWNEISSRWEGVLAGAGTALDLYVGDITAVDVGVTGTITGMTNTTGTGSIVLATSPTLVTPAIGAATGSSLQLTGALTAASVYAHDDVTADSFGDFGSLKIDGGTVIDGSAHASFASMASTGAVSGTTGTFSGAISGAGGTLTGNLTMSGATRRVLLREWDGVAGNEGRIVFDGSDDADTYLGASGTDSVTQVINGANVIRYTQFYVRNETGSTQMQWSAGSASAPAYSKNGDTNTGIFFSGADAVDFATGGTRAGGFSSSQAFEVAGASITLGGVKITRGTGSPESVVTGSVGDLFLRTDGGASTTLYIKESGSATNTGWVGK
jgi:hypothetical protein